MIGTDYAGFKKKKEKKKMYELLQVLTPPFT